MNAATDWQGFEIRREKLGLPLRPDGTVVDRLAAILGGHAGSMLMLGLTRELAVLGTSLTIADWNGAMLDAFRAQARPQDVLLQADWLQMQFPPDAFDAVIGDGSLTTLTWHDAYSAVFDNLAGCVKPGGLVVIRFFVAPDVPESIDAVVHAVLAGEERNFHALKWRVAMVLAAQRGGNIAVNDIAETFDAIFPDRAALTAKAGFAPDEIAQIDAYQGSDAVYSFVTRAQIEQTLPAAFEYLGFESSGDYALSDRCPFLVARRR